MARRGLWIGLGVWIATTLLASTGWGGSIGRADLNTLRTPIYSVDGDAFVRHNGDRYCNRPLYCNQISAVVFAGDRPYLRLGQGPVIAGNFMVAIVRDGKGKWLHEWSDITSKYRPGRMEWIARDASLPEISVTLQAAPAAEGAGLAVRLTVEGARDGDQLIFASGAALEMSRSTLWDCDVTTAGRDALLKRGFVTDDCKGDRIRLAKDSWTIQPPASKRPTIAIGRCSAPSNLKVADAAAWKDPVALASSSGKELPILCGTVSLAKTKEIFWTLQSVTGDKAPDAKRLASPPDTFAAGLRRAEMIAKQVVVQTPDPWLNAAVGASCTVTDGVFRDGIFTHSGMRWGVPLLGWRTIFGGTVYGWHDRVITQAKKCISKQILESDKILPKANPTTGYSSQAPESRFFGQGRVDTIHPRHYDMQTQFFDQLIHAWRWTGNEELAKLLRPALELHLQYIRECFDPDNDGIYESYANTWPTDDQWYNGGGTSEETAYAYRAHQAALDLARLANDTKTVARHQAQLDKIRTGFFNLLWKADKGHPGAYREQGGHQRLHDSGWLYAIFCPIDANLLNAEQAAQSLHYTEYELERVSMPYGGQQCWPSNWVPSVWSVREMWPGDNYHLALAYYQTGLADDGWKLLRGTFPQMMFFGPVPGDLGYPCGGTDFNDCYSMFCRTVVEGLFGYAPDYPNRIIKIAPQFPADWDHASIKTPDVSIAFRRNGATSAYSVELTKASAMDLRLPLNADSVAEVKVNGQSAEWKLLSGFGQGVVQVQVPLSRSAAIEVTGKNPLPQAASVAMDGRSGDRVKLQADGARIVEFRDPQNVLSEAKVENGAIVATLTKNAGHHMVLALAEVGQTRQWRTFKIHVTDAEADAAREAKQVREIPSNATWGCLDLGTVLNGDIRTIFKQQYLSPRPNTCSLRLASDGYSTWQMMLDPKHKTPEIDLTGVTKLLKADRLVTPAGVPFHWPGESKNIAFTSLWDNWPRSVEIPVNKKGEAIWLLVCGSTNPMQVRIANAEIRMKYADGVIEKLELTPPFNFWSLCRFGDADYNYQRDAFSLPATPPAMVQLGNNCRAMVLNWRLRPGVALERVTLESLSQEVVIGLMGATVMNPANP